MTFESQEVSVQDARPVELLQMRLDSSFFTYSNSGIGETFNGQAYVAAPWRRTQPKVNSDQPGSEVEILMPTNAPSTQSFARQWVTSAPESRSTKVTIYKHHQDDPDDEFRVFWIGTIVSLGYENEGRDTVVLCRSLDNLFTLQGPRKNWGTQCNHELYDSECQLSESAFTQVGTVISVSATGTRFAVEGINPPNVRFRSGEMRLVGGIDARMIIGQVANLFTVQYPFPSISVGSLVEIIEGCGHNLTDCGLFPNADEVSGTNIENYGASPFTPDLNPFEKGLDAV